MSHDHDFHIPANNIWPPITCLGAGLLAFGFITLLHFSALVGQIVMVSGLLIIAFAASQWFRALITESRNRGFKETPLLLEMANRYGMIFFIVSEVMFFSAFFAAFFYLQMFNTAWPPSNIEPIGIDLPVVNTLLLLTSGATITWAHHALRKGKMLEAKRATQLTWILGLIFLTVQIYEYGHLAFGLDGGVFGSTFYMLTGFHGFHVFVGSIMLMVLSRRLGQGDFSARHHFYFEGAAWYWHFVDVVWVGLFIFVYLL